MRYLVLIALLECCSRESPSKKGPRDETGQGSIPNRTASNERVSQSSDEERAGQSPDELYVKVEDPVYRHAWQPGKKDHGKIKFRIRGNTKVTIPLGNGEIRHQFGLMLRGKNECNLVYAMVRLDEQRVVVQEKYNLGMSTHRECKNNGYTTVVPKLSSPIPELRLNQPHDLDAQFIGRELNVYLNKALVWSGTVPDRIKNSDYTGFRSDNLRIDFQLSQPNLATR